MDHPGLCGQVNLPGDESVDGDLLNAHLFSLLWGQNLISMTSVRTLSTGIRSSCRLASCSRTVVHTVTLVKIQNLLQNCTCLL